MDERTSADSRSLPPKRKYPWQYSFDSEILPALPVSLAVDLPLLMKLCAKVADKWKSIGIQLGVPHHDLSSIQGNNRGDPQMVQNCLSDMFNWWLNNRQDVTPKKLAQALHVADEHRLEVDVKERFCLSLKPCFDIDCGHHLAESGLPDYVRRYCYDIKKRYVQQPVLPESDWPPNLGGQYIRLALIKQGRTRGDFKHRAVVELQEDYVRGEYDKILEHKTKIKLEEIFDPVFCGGGYEIPLKMLIDGAPGVGKTTLSREVSQKWAKGELLQGYWLVLLLHLRERSISKAHMIDNFFYHDDQLVQNATVTFVKETSGKGVLIIFDGFDELSLTERREQSLFLDIIKGKVLNECAVVVTSRPYASRPVQELQLVNRHIEVLGFTDEQIHKCIKQRINDETKAKELCSELKHRLDIASICQIPLNCSIVLYVYEIEDYQLPDTLSELYELFILHCLRRYATRNNVSERLHSMHKLPWSIQNHFSVLSKVAYDGLNEDKLVFEQEGLELAFSRTFSGTDLPVLDLMTSAKSYSRRGPHDTYSFLHLIIQEYLGAFWAARNLSESEKLKFLLQNLRNERFYMVLWFFAGITRLNISNVRSIFTNNLWEYDNHVHLCHLLYESDSKSHSLCSYVANNCILKKEISFIGKSRLENITSWKYPAYFKSNVNSKYSKFDGLMIAHFLAHSNCQWDTLMLNVDDVQVFHRVFNGLKSCYMTVKQVIIEVHQLSITKFHEGTIRLLDEIPQFDNVRLNVMLAGLSKTVYQAIKSNFRNTLKKTKAIKSIIVEIVGSNKHEVIRNIYDELIEGIADSGSLVSNLKFRTVTVEAVEYLMSLLIKWNSNLKLVTLSVSKNQSRYCPENKRCCEFCSLLSTFLSKNVSLRRIDISPPFESNHLMSCIDTIQSGLDQNSTLEELHISEKIVFRRNKHTSKLELDEDCRLLRSPCLSRAAIIKEGDASHPIAVPGCMELSPVMPQLETSGIQTLCRVPSRDSESPYIDDGGIYIDSSSSQASPVKRPKVGNSSKDSLWQTAPVHVQPQLNLQQLELQPSLAAFSSSHLPTLAHSLHPPLFFSQCATVSPQSMMQPSYCMAGSSLTRGTYYYSPRPKRNYQVLPQEQNDHQYHQSRNDIPIWTCTPHGQGSTNTAPLLRPAPPTVMQNQSYSMPYQQHSHENFPQYRISPSFSYYQSTYPHLHAGMNQLHNMLPQYPYTPAQTFVMPLRIPPTADHPMQHFTSEPEQHHPATAPPVQTIHNPNTQTPSTTSYSVGHSPPLPTTSTLT